MGLRASLSASPPRNVNRINSEPNHAPPVNLCHCFPNDEYVLVSTFGWVNALRYWTQQQIEFPLPQTLTFSYYYEYRATPLI